MELLAFPDDGAKALVDTGSKAVYFRANEEATLMAMFDGAPMAVEDGEPYVCSEWVEHNYAKTSKERQNVRLNRKSCLAKLGLIR